MLPVSISFQDAAPHLRQGSSVITISSIAGYNPEKGLTMYGVTKTALLGLTKVYVHLFFCHFSLCLLYDGGYVPWVPQGRLLPSKPNGPTGKSPTTGHDSSWGLLDRLRSNPPTSKPIWTHGALLTTCQKAWENTPCFHRAQARPRDPGGQGKGAT